MRPQRYEAFTGFSLTQFGELTQESRDGFRTHDLGVLRDHRLHRLAEFGELARRQLRDLHAVLLEVVERLTFLLARGLALDFSGLARRVGDDLSFAGAQRIPDLLAEDHRLDRKSTRLNSSHRCISYAVFCLKK